VIPALLALLLGGTLAAFLSGALAPEMAVNLRVFWAFLCAFGFTVFAVAAPAPLVMQQRHRRAWRWGCAAFGLAVLALVFALHGALRLEARAALLGIGLGLLWHGALFGAVAAGRGRIVLTHHLLGLLVVLTAFPIIYMLATSLKSNANIQVRYWAVPIPGFARDLLAQLPGRAGQVFGNALLPEYDNYRVAFKQIAPYVLNSIFISTTTVFLMLFLSSLSAFVFARYDFKGKEPLYMAILALLMVPGVLTLIPAFKLVSQLGLFNTHLALILPYVSGGQIFAMFILRQFFEGIPQDFFDAARIDGAGEFRVYRLIVLPLSKPILGTVAVMNVMYTWNDYVWPLVTLSSEKLRTVAIGIMYFRDQHMVYHGHLMAGNALASLPIILLFLFTMKLFIRGITSGGMKV